MPSYTHKMAIVSWPQILWRHFTLCMLWTSFNRWAAAVHGGARSERTPGVHINFILATREVREPATRRGSGEAGRSEIRASADATRGTPAAARNDPRWTEHLDGRRPSADHARRLISLHSRSELATKTVVACHWSVVRARCCQLQQLALVKCSCMLAMTVVRCMASTRPWHSRHILCGRILLRKALTEPRDWPRLEGTVAVAEPGRQTFLMHNYASRRHLASNVCSTVPNLAPIGDGMEYRSPLFSIFGHSCGISAGLSFVEGVRINRSRWNLACNGSACLTVSSEFLWQFLMRRNMEDHYKGADARSDKLLVGVWTKQRRFKGRLERVYCPNTSQRVRQFILGLRSGDRKKECYSKSETNVSMTRSPRAAERTLLLDSTVDTGRQKSDKYDGTKPLTALNISRHTL